ncbi:unnamed protein product [marine sediment metagenome]|uniref:Uncharacterized protein n=1 Tax=marine sediment metagenome TaxID=412755 RepID=X1BAG6_9ZZZZ
MGKELKKRGALGSDRRITIPKIWKDKFPDGVFYELEIQDNKIVITFFAVETKKGS